MTSAPTLLPLAAAPLDAPFAWRAGRCLSVSRFLADAAQLAKRLATDAPADGAPVNLCVDRYHFALGFAAALQCGQTSLLPPNALPQTLSRLRDHHPSLFALVDAPGDAAALPHVVVGAGASFPAIVLPEPDAARGAVPGIDAALSAATLLTSGSTGEPQPHSKQWGTMVANIRAEAQRISELLGRASLAGVALVATVPPQHSYGFESSVLLALVGGASFDAGRPFYPADITDALARVPRPRALVTTPFHLKTLLAAGLALPPTDLVLSATAPLSPQLAAQAERAFGGALIEIYGCTEAGQVATRRTSATDVWHCYAGLRLTRDGDDKDRSIVRGGHVIEPTPLADVLELIDAEHFRLLGRANDVIHVAGKRSSLAHLNYQLNRIEGIEDGAFWLPDSVVAPGDAIEAIVRPVAFVVAPDLSAKAIVASLRAVLEPAFVPRRIVHVDALPREATGKLTADALKRLAAQHLSPRSQR